MRATLARGSVQVSVDEAGRRGRRDGGRAVRWTGRAHPRGARQRWSSCAGSWVCRSRWIWRRWPAFLRLERDRRRRPAAARVAGAAARCSPRRWRRCSERGPRKGERWPRSCGCAPRRLDADRGRAARQDRASLPARAAAAPAGAAGPGAAGRPAAAWTPAAWPRRWRCWPIAWTSPRSWPAWRPTAIDAATRCWRATRRPRRRGADAGVPAAGAGARAQHRRVEGRRTRRSRPWSSRERPSWRRSASRRRISSDERYFRRGILMVISSPSGAGKTTLTRRLAETHKLHFSVSYTTRPPRPGEVDGKDYHFVSNDDVQQDGRRPGVRRARGGARQPLRHGHHHREQGHRAGHRLPVRHRLPGRPADPPAVAQGQRAGVHPAARRWPSWSAGCAAGPPTRPR